MIFGMPTLLEMKDMEACVALCRELGLGFAEINMNLPQYQADRLNVSALDRATRENGVFLTIHLDENLNPCDFNDRVADAYADTLLRTIKIARQLSVPILNMHLSTGVFFTLPDRKAFLFDVYQEAYLQKLTALRDACTAAIGDSGLKICVENTGGYGQAAFLKRGLDLLLESPAFALTFDIGHDHGIGGLDEPILLARRHRLAHMHMHDAVGKQNHLALGEGELDLPRYLALAGACGCRVVLETKTVLGLRRSVQWLRERGWL